MLPQPNCGYMSPNFPLNQSAGISLPVAEVAHDYTATTYTMPVQPVNNSKVKRSQFLFGGGLDNSNVAVNNNSECDLCLPEYKGDRQETSVKLPLR